MELLCRRQHVDDVRLYTLTSLRRNCVCISASMPIAGVNSSLNKTRFMTRVKSRRIVTKFNSFLKMSDKKRHNLLKTVTLFNRLIKHSVCSCHEVNLRCFHCDFTEMKHCSSRKYSVWSVWSLYMNCYTCISNVFNLFANRKKRKSKSLHRVYVRIMWR